MKNSLLEALLVIDCNCRRRVRTLPCEDKRQLQKAVTLIGTEVLHCTLTNHEPVDAEQLVSAYIASGGNWHDLTTAVNRHALEGATKELN